MDEFLDFFDAAESFFGTSDLDLLDDSILDALGLLLEGAEYFPSAPDFLEAVSGLNPEEFDLPVEGRPFDVFSEEELIHMAEGLDAEPAEIKTVFNFDAIDPQQIETLDFHASYIEAEAAKERLAEMLDSVPGPLRAGLGRVEWNVVQHPDYLGRYLPVDLDHPGGLPKISLFDRAEELEMTMAHEIGHHIVRRYPQLFEQFREIALTEPDLWNHEWEHLKEYEDMQLWDDELFAQAVMHFQTQPAILQEVSPRTYDFIFGFWSEAMNSGTV